MGKYNSVFIAIFKVLAIIFIISAIATFISSLIYTIKNDLDDTFIYVLINLSVNLFFRIVLGGFFFIFAMFFEGWLKIYGKE